MRSPLILTNRLDSSGSATILGRISGQIGRQGTDGSGIERDDAVFSARSAAFDKGPRQADVRDVQGDQLADAHTGGIERFEHGLVAIALAIDAFRLLEQQLDLPSGQNLRQLLFGLLLRDRAHRIFRRKTLGDAITVKALERGDAAGNGRRGLAVLRQVLRVAADARTIHALQRRLPVGSQIVRELAHVAQVRRNGVCRSVPDIQKKTLVSSDQISHLFAAPLSQKLGIMGTSESIGCGAQRVFRPSLSVCKP